MDLQPFSQNGLELVINTETGEAFASARAIARMMSTDSKSVAPSQITSYGKTLLSSGQISEPLEAQIQTQGGLQAVKLFNESQILVFFAKYRPNLIAVFSDFIWKRFNRRIIFPQLAVKTEKHPPKYLYIIQCSETLVIKIGISNNPLKRLKALQTSYPYELNLIKKIKTKHCRQKEKQLHIALEPLKLKGEWFDSLALQLINC